MAVDFLEPPDWEHPELAPIKTIEFQPSSLETIDQALYNWLYEELRIFATTNKGRKRVPVIWVSTERAFQIKNNKELRDDNGNLKLPLITIERTSVVKDPTMHGRLTANIFPVNDARGGTVKIGRKINQEKTSLFASNRAARKVGGGRDTDNSDDVAPGSFASSSVGDAQQYYPRANKLIVYETMSIPLPVYVNLNYSITLKTEYQQQINELLTPFLVRTGQINNFNLHADGHRFEGFLPKDFGSNNNASDIGEEERIFETKFDIRVLGHLIGEGDNQERPKITIRENAVEFTPPRERTILGDRHPEAVDPAETSNNPEAMPSVPAANTTRSYADQQSAASQAQSQNPEASPTTDTGTELSDPSFISI